MHEERIESWFMEENDALSGHMIGQEVMEYIIDSGLITTECCIDNEHGTLTAWSINAAEQIGAHIKDYLGKHSKEK